MFIAIEGPDGVGKTSIAKNVVQLLGEDGSHAVFESFPGKNKGTIGELVYRLHHESADAGVEQCTATSLQAMHVAAHLDAIERWLLPIAASDSTLVLDRYWWSTWVYGMAGGVSEIILDCLLQAEVEMWGRCQPDVIVLIERDAPIDRKVAINAWKQLVGYYDRLANRESKAQCILRFENTMETVEEASSKVLQLVKDRLN